MISAPSCYGKLPALGDYFQYRAARAEMGMWWSRFVKLLDNPLTFGPAAQHVWCFVLPRELFSWSAGDYVAGVITLSSDRIGRRYPLVVWQKVSPKGLKHNSFFGEDDAQHNWLYWLSRLVTAYTMPQDAVLKERSARHFEEAVDALWDLHRPRWHENFGWGFHVDKEAQCLRLTGMPPASDLAGVRHMPWADWPARLWQGSPLCYFWQQDGQARYLRAVVDRHLDTRVLATLFEQE